jgi:hypothetical protein
MTSSTELGPSTRKESLGNIKPVTYETALRCLGNAAYTLFVTPEHEKLHQTAEVIGTTKDPQPLQPSLYTTVTLLKSEVLPQVDTNRVPQLDRARLLQLAGVLIQFTDYTPRLQDRVQVPYENIQNLHEGIRAKAKEDGPLGFAEQLAVALDQNDNDMMESLWSIFIASRMHARWLDGRIIKNLPDYTKEEKIKLMLDWRESITACKPSEAGDVQDPVGDCYYAWTHTLAKYAYSLAPTNETISSRMAVRAFHRGTNIMHKVVHTFNKQAINSDHTTAAIYGNTIGEACVDRMKMKSPLAARTSLEASSSIAG